jgi:hypothetical protein
VLTLTHDLETERHESPDDAATRRVDGELRGTSSGSDAGLGDIGRLDVTIILPRLVAKCVDVGLGCRTSVREDRLVAVPLPKNDPAQRQRVSGVTA